MANPAGYRPILSELAAEFLLSLSRRRQRKFMDRARELAAHPFFISDYVETDADGRSIDHLMTDGFVVAYWVDHATRTVFIVDVVDAE